MGAWAQGWRGVGAVWCGRWRALAAAQGSGPWCCGSSTPAEVLECAGPQGMLPCVSNVHIHQKVTISTHIHQVTPSLPGQRGRPTAPKLAR